MSISKEEVLHIAKLARLKIKEDNLESISKQLSSIVDLTAELSLVDVTDVKPTDHILDIKNIFKKDEVQSSFAREEILKNAPTKEGGCISVPKVVE